MHGPVVSHLFLQDRRDAEGYSFILVAGASLLACLIASLCTYWAAFKVHHIAVLPVSFYDVGASSNVLILLPGFFPPFPTFSSFPFPPPFYFSIHSGHFLHLFSIPIHLPHLFDSGWTPLLHYALHQTQLESLAGHIDFLETFHLHFSGHFYFLINFRLNLCVSGILSTRPNQIWQYPDKRARANRRRQARPKGKKSKQDGRSQVRAHRQKAKKTNTSRVQTTTRIARPRNEPVPHVFCSGCVLNFFFFWFSSSGTGRRHCVVLRTEQQLATRTTN